MTNKEIALCNSIIHSASVSAGAVGAGLAQIPCSDNVIITPIQIAMAISLGRVFHIELDKSTAKGVVASANAAAAGRCISQMLISFLPGASNVVNASTAAALTETIGWTIANRFAKEEKS